MVGAAANSSSQIVAREAVLIDLLQKTNFALQAQLAAATAVGMSMSQVGGRGRGRRRGEGLSEPLSAEYVSCPNMYTHTHMHLGTLHSADDHHHLCHCQTAGPSTLRLLLLGWGP